MIVFRWWEHCLRWTTYNRLIDKIATADRIADQRLVHLAAQWMKDG